MNFTAKQLEDAINNDKDLYWEDLDYGTHSVEINGIEYNIEFIEENERGEWDFDTFVILKVNGRTFKKTGHFRSHYGNYWDGPFAEVVRGERVVEDWIEVVNDAEEVTVNSVLAATKSLLEDDVDDFWDDPDLYTINIGGVDYQPVTLAITGGMDKGSDASVVFQVGDKIFKKTGFYQSHYGYDWDGDLTEVRPVEKVVTFYE